MAVFFGWLFILIRTALHKRSELCLDCGAIRRYRTAGANIAAVFLVVVVIPMIILTLVALMK